MYFMKQVGRFSKATTAKHNTHMVDLGSSLVYSLWIGLAIMRVEGSEQCHVIIALNFKDLKISLKDLGE